MRRNKHIFLALFFIVTVGSLLIGQNIPDRPSPPRLVNDLAGILTSSQQQQLEKKLVDYDDTTSTQIAIVLVKSIGNWDIGEYSFAIGDQWGVGSRGKDNGIVITVAEAERKTFIATGRGTEGAVTDIHAHRVINNIMIPEFSNGNFYRGLDKATSALMRLLDGEYVPEATDDNDSTSDGIIFFIIFIIIILILFRNSGGHDGGSIGRGGWRGPIIIPGGGSSGGFGGGGFSGGGGFGGFGGGSFGGGGAGGSW